MFIGLDMTKFFNIRYEQSGFPSQVVLVLDIGLECHGAGLVGADETMRRFKRLCIL